MTTTSDYVSIVDKKLKANGGVPLTMTVKGILIESSNLIVNDNSNKWSLHNEIQRDNDTWKQVDIDGYIHALLHNLTVDPVIISEHKDIKKTYICDGGHRIYVIQGFYSNTIKYKGRYFNQLSAENREDFLDSQILVKKYTDLTSDQESVLVKSANSGLKASSGELIGFQSETNDFFKYVKHCANNKSTNACSSIMAGNRRNRKWHWELYALLVVNFHYNKMKEYETPGNEASLKNFMKKHKSLTYSLNKDEMDKKITEFSKIIEKIDEKVKEKGGYPNNKQSMHKFAIMLSQFLLINKHKKPDEVVDLVSLVLTDKYGEFKGKYKSHTSGGKSISSICTYVLNW